MKKRLIFAPVVAVLCCAGAFAAGLQSEEMLFPVSWSGATAMRSGSYQQAIEELRKRKDDPDTAARLFKLATAYLRAGDSAKALSNFNAAMAKDDALAPLAWVAIGDILQKKKLDNKKKIGNVLACYGRALAVPLPLRYRNQIFEKITAIIGSDTTPIAGAHFFADFSQWANSHKPPAPPPPDSLHEQVATAIRDSLWPRIDSVISRTLETRGTEVQCAIVKLIDSAQVPDSALSAAGFFSLAKIAEENHLFDLSERMLALAQHRPALSTSVGPAVLQRFRAKLFFDERKYDDAVGELTRYMKKYGYESDLLLLTARAYKILDNIDKAALWYDRFIARTPHYPALAEMLWRRAWMEEDRGQPAAAMGFYSRIYTAFPKSQRAEESYIRRALCLYQMGKYDSAWQVLTLFEKRNPTSSFLAASQYWRAKCRCGRNNPEAAKLLLDSVARREPFDYYAHRARDLLVFLGDTLNSRLLIDSVYDNTRAIAWLDSVAPPSKKQVTPEDSLNFRRGVVLATVGDVAEAEIFLESMELWYPGNLSLQFKIAALYRLAQAPSLSAGAGRRLSWRIPYEDRANIPLPAYTLMYPFFFRDIIKSEAQRWNVDPYFVSAVIRQESSFNPEALSPVGAVGLMQIMPATARAIARELHEPFSIDSLYHPSANIRYGTYYLRKLLDQFNENEVLVLASYNGGPPNAKEWYLRNKEKDPDLLVEGIGFSETRNYVKKVMANFWIYRKLSRLGTPILPY